MNENISFETYFQTPVYVNELPELVDKLNKASDPHIAWSKNNTKDMRKERDKAVGKKLGDFGMTHHSGPLVGLPEFADIQGYVERRSLEIMDHIGYDMTTYNMTWTEMWVQEFSKKGAGYHNAHIHYDNHISGFYFLKSSEHTAYPILKDPRVAKMMSMLPLKKPNDITMGSGSIHFKPKPGTLVLFPAYIEHEFTVDLGIDPFRFMHFNLQAVRKTVNG
tara:strand:+ start:3750 stop:4409 length:660 start_codon:yes stop_codon:yes gene_type:complete